MSVAINGTNGITYNDGSLQPSAPVGRNLIINGNMQIAQRATSVAGITSAGYYTCDRWKIDNTTAGTWTQTQDTDVPTGQGFTSSIKLNCTTADASLAAGDKLGLETKLEGLNCQQLGYGTANAKSTTLSFWVKSNQAGVYTFEYFQGDSSRSISQTYTISVGNTWEKKTITIDGDTSGVINNDSGLGLLLKWWLAAGTSWTSGTLATSWATLSNPNRVSSSNVNLAEYTSNYVNITGVQLEVGTTATPFEHLQYTTQLELCQRYFFRMNGTYYGGNYASGAFISGMFPVQMRAAPTITYTITRTPLFGLGFGYSNINALNGYVSASGYVTGLQANAEL